jgi:hypothetical protein
MFMGTTTATVISVAGRVRGGSIFHQRIDNAFGVTVESTVKSLSWDEDGSSPDPALVDSPQHVGGAGGVGERAQLGLECDVTRRGRT